MPELPEVETTLRGIEPFVVGQSLTKVVVRNPSLRWPVQVDELAALVGERVTSLERRAKYLLLHTDSACILLHLGMSGSLRVVDSDSDHGKHDHIDLEFSDQKVVRFNDPRRFGCCLVIRDSVDQHRLLSRLGPEPLSDNFHAEWLFQASRGKNQTIKTLIMDNTVVVGVGNIYASESLFKAGIRPTMSAKRISRARCEKLVNEIVAVLSKAIRAGGTTLNDFTQSDGKPGYFAQELQVYGRVGQPCYRCGDEIQSKVIVQRNTFYCRNCQKH